MFSERLFAVAFAVVFSVAQFGCQQKAAQPSPRYAILRFENLSGDASLDWTGRAASEILSTTLNGALSGPVLNPMAVRRQGATLGPRPGGAPGVSSERAEALLAGASHIITGYVERVAGKIRMTAVEEELASHRVVRTVSADGTTPYGALEALGKAISPAARPFLTRNEETIRVYAMTLESDAPPAEEELKRILAADPDFGPGWLVLANARLRRGDREAAQTTLAEAETHKLDPVSAANVAIEAAQLIGDKAGALAAERKLSAISPGDTMLVRALADREMADGRFKEAAGDWKTLANTLVTEPGPWNSLAYARSYAGDYAGALEALQTYGRLRPADPNVEDSTGDLNYAFGRFAEAATHYLAANRKDPAFLRGGDLYKAAWARLMTGDKTGAETLFTQFREYRKTGDPFLPLLEVDWLYQTDRVPQATATLRKALSELEPPNPQFTGTGFAQLAVWDLLAGDRKQAAIDAAAAGAPGSVPLIIVRFATLPSAPAAEWRARAEKMMGNPAVAPLKNVALAYALLLDGHRAEAIPVWEEVVKTSPATDFFVRAVLAGLQGHRPDRILVPDPNSANPFGVLAVKANQEPAGK